MVSVLKLGVRVTVIYALIVQSDNLPQRKRKTEQQRKKTALLKLMYTWYSQPGTAVQDTYQVYVTKKMSNKTGQDLPKLRIPGVFTLSNKKVVEQTHYQVRNPAWASFRVPYSLFQVPYGTCYM